MNVVRLVPIHVHAALETLVGPLLMVAPFLLGFSTGAMIASVVLGALVMGTALAAAVSLTPEGARRSQVRVSAHAEADVALAVATAACAIGSGLAGDSAAAGFFGATAIALSLLAMTTRYSTLRG
jgi:hypothetical protein